MRAVDTNILVRFLTGDDPAQHARAVDILGRGEVWIAKSVLLELNWVLRKTYGFGADAAANGVEAICGLSVAVLEEEEAVFLALKWSRQGLEFADALHLASRGRSETFATFDRSLLRAARKLGLPVEEP